MNNLTTDQKDHLKELVVALRSGKYKQTKSALRDNEGFCCLGVACDLYRKKQKKSLWKIKLGQFFFLGSMITLPEKVQKYFGLTEEGEIPTTIHSRYDKLWSLNDNGYSFIKIANIIEDQFLS